MVSAYRGLVTSLENVEPEEGDKQEEDQEDQEEMMEEEGEEEYSEEKEEEEEPNEDENDMMEEDSQSHPATEESEEEKPLDDKTLWEQMQKFGDYEEQMLGKEDSEDESIDMMAPISGMFVIILLSLEQEEEEEEEEEEVNSLESFFATGFFLCLCDFTFIFYLSPPTNELYSTASTLSFLNTRR